MKLIVVAVEISMVIAVVVMIILVMAIVIVMDMAFVINNTQQAILQNSVLQPPRNKRIDLVHKDQIRNPSNFKVLPLAYAGSRGRSGSESFAEGLQSARPNGRRPCAYSK